MRKCATLSVSNKTRVMAPATLLAILLSLATIPAAAQPELPDRTRGTGTHFALPNSPYLPVTLDSSVSVSLELSSVPKIVSLLIEPDTTAGSALFTLSGFAANTLYYRYSDSGLNPVAFTTDTTGGFTYIQDLTEPHHVWFRDRPSTYHLYDDATGGDCLASLGTWSSATKTCSLTLDVNDAIFIENSGITLDGAGHQISVPGNLAVYSWGNDNVTIKNLNVVRSAFGIFIGLGSYATLKDNTISGADYGIFGPYYLSNDNTISGNTISNSRSYGIFGPYLYSDNNTISGNTLSNSKGYGLYTGIYTRNNQVFNNNFISNAVQIVHDATGSSGDTFNRAAPVGGNYFSNFNTPSQGCNNINGDTFCDARYVFPAGQDNLPWTTQDGWLTPTDNAAPTASPTQSPAANGAGWNNSDVTVTWNWSDEAGGSGIDTANCTTSDTSTGEGNPFTLSVTCKDAAGNTGSASYMVNVDKTPPTVSLIGGPADGGSYDFGGVPAAPTCSPSDARSGLDGSCTVSGYSATVGPHTVTATARDKAGNQSATSATYTVLPWAFSGFYQPVDMGNVWNSVKNGATIPIKFEVFAGTTELTETSIVVQPFTASQSPCGGGATDVIELVARGATRLRYDAISGQFIYNWQTPKKPGYCYVVTVTLIDGTSRNANIKLR